MTRLALYISPAWAAHNNVSHFIIKRSILTFQINADPTVQESDHARPIALAVTASAASWVQTASSHASRGQEARIVQRPVCSCLNDCSHDA